MIEVGPRHCLADTRAMLQDEFDKDMLPDGDYYFCVDGVRLSSKQEQRKLAWDLIGRMLSIEAKKRPAEAAVVVAKKARSVDEEAAAEGKQHAPSASVASQAKIMVNAAAELSNDDDLGPPAGDLDMVIMEASAETNVTPKPNVETGANQDKESVASTEPKESDELIYPDEEAVEKSSTAEKAVLDLDMDDKRPSSEPTGHGSNSNEPVTKQAEEKTFTTMDADAEDSTTEATKASAVESSTDSDPVLMAADDQDDEEAAEDEEEELDELIVTAVVSKNDPHKIHDEAIAKSCSVLKGINQLLAENPLFCPENRRKEWTEEINEMLDKSAPNTVIGVLGNTGVGKSSLLNALLDEASVLPTSGSRGCTAAVVELRFNKDLLSPMTNVPVYKGQVEFVTLDEWGRELKILLAECSTNEEKTIYARPPDDQRQPEVAAAWQKINQVYGKGTMEKFHGHQMGTVYQRLFNDRRVNALLGPNPNSTTPYNSVIVAEGEVEPDQAKGLTVGFSEMNGRLRRSKKKWAQSFRGKINDYVYRKGNGHEPQTWPLIRKVVLHGPWPVLLTGACLVDLPGVRDANAARAKVSEQYLQNCSQIWVVAPIKRAVDDGTAKELLGEQFKRRLLMDGQYGNVSFICTQTDDCEATETMRDHQDVAMKVPGRWEKMSELADKISAIDSELSGLRQEEEDLRIEHEEAERELKDAEDELQDATAETVTADSDDEDFQGVGGNKETQVDIEHLQSLHAAIGEKKEAASKALLQLTTWQTMHKVQFEKLEDRSCKLQRRLKCMCATVRNEYSKACLQEDFRAGLEELTRKPDEEEGGSSTAPELAPIPDDFEMDVFCISANDYLKGTGIKPGSDGPPSTFTKAEDTQIPALREFVHEVTAKYRLTFSEAFVNGTSDMLDRVKLVAADAKNVPSGRSSRRCKVVYDNEMAGLQRMVKPVVNHFRHQMDQKVRSALQPALKAGAAKGNQAAMHTVMSWGSKNRRTRHERGPDKNGLYWSTYFATVRREGVYVSASAGQIDFNQELCDPVEKEFSADWQRIMDTTVRLLLRECERKVAEICSALDKAMAAGLSEAGVGRDRIAPMVNAASRSCTTALKASFQAMFEVAANSQRDLNRSLLPKVQDRMQDGYTAAVGVPSGTGRFARIKSAVESHADQAVRTLFDDATVELLTAIGNLIDQLASMMGATAEVITKTMTSVYSVCWEDQTAQSVHLDPAMQAKVRACRDKLLPALNKLAGTQTGALELLGIEREDLELEMAAVESWEERNAKKMQAAIETGDLIDLCDSDDENMTPKNTKPPAVVSTVRKVKPEPGLPALPWVVGVTPQVASARPSITPGHPRMPALTWQPPRFNPNQARKPAP